MKFTLALVAAGLVAAQDFSGVPQCALPCLADAIPKVGCALTDTACQCSTEKQEALVPIAAPCLLSACNSGDLGKAQSAAAAACSRFLATASAQPSASAAASSAPAAATSASAAVSSAAASASASASAPASAAATTASAAVTPSSNATASITLSRTPSTANPTGTGAGASATPSSSGNAAPQGTAAVGGVALAALAGLVAAVL
ncbi:hypothetical protein CMUS01_04038 [Colletotrichum musicola]|uniref:CFEM domain-containing protein n=2 Tax=Colletotrichum orchidearum species complex TaxID=2707337 RepID=A0A8H6NPI8_9PEZI|nr:hypothetical protein CPLU01_13847 [Colletotrichum plurivorum]KAF6840144.1 hypothetical protein CMUS01_04038 [Colletotrichum musicola]